MASTFAARLLRWFDGARRDLPWRRTRDPWAIWVSEIMLQQTRVEAVRETYERFMERYPSPDRFAAADDEELLQAWKGLGYYRRARLLRQGARQVVDEHGGVVPSTANALGALAGVGSYTRGAIASIAFDAPEPAIDGNVERVFARHAAIRSDVKKRPAQREIEDLVHTHMDRARPGDFNQALMELGALVCTPRSPRCADCPIATDCRGLAEGLADVLPVLPQRKKAIDVRPRAVVCDRGRGRFLAWRVPAGEINEGQLELPGSGVFTTCESPADLAHALRDRFRAEFEIGSEVATVKHGITHHRITLTAHAGAMVGRRPQALEDADRDGPWTTAARKILSRL